MADDNPIPLRKGAAFRPARPQEVVAGFSIDPVSMEIVWRNPDGTITRESLLDDKRFPVGSSTSDRDGPEG